MKTTMDRPIEFPFSPHPVAGELRQVADGIFWVRIPLPFRLDHVNVWIVEDGDGWAIVDCGVDDPVRRDIWAGMLSGDLAGKPIRRVIATHGHTDHVGAAGFLRDRNDAQFETTLTEWMSARLRYADHRQDNSAALQRFLASHGAGAELLKAYDQERARVSRYLGPQPAAITRLVHGQIVKLGGRQWQVIVGAGHADEHATLFCATDSILIAGDQILPRISPLVAVSPLVPDADPLSAYLMSLADFRKLPDHALVLPGHGEPFYGLHVRIAQLIAHHDKRLNELAAIIRQPLTAFGATAALFPKAAQEGQGRLALGETLAHLHRLVALERAQCAIDGRGVTRFVTTAPAAVADLT